MLLGLDKCIEAERHEVEDIGEHRAALHQDVQHMAESKEAIQGSDMGLERI